jgi:hypothetical protein
MFPRALGDNPMPIAPEDIPIEGPLESAAVPTQVPATVEVPVGLTGVDTVGVAVGLVGVAGEDPLQAATVTAVKRVSDAIQVRIECSFERPGGHPPTFLVMHETIDP